MRCRSRTEATVYPTISLPGCGVIAKGDAWTPLDDRGLQALLMVHGLCHTMRAEATIAAGVSMTIPSFGGKSSSRCLDKARQSRHVS